MTTDSLEPLPSAQRLLRLVRDLASMPDRIDCAATVDRLASYVDVELDQGELNEALEQVAYHLASCPKCLQVLDLLRSAVGLDKLGEPLPLRGDP